MPNPDVSLHRQSLCASVTAQVRIEQHWSGASRAASHLNLVVIPMFLSGKDQQFTACYLFDVLNLMGT